MLAIRFDWIGRLTSGLARPLLALSSLFIIEVSDSVSLAPKSRLGAGWSALQEYIKISAEVRAMYGITMVRVFCLLYFFV